MLDRKKYLLNWWDKTKIAIGILCIILAVVQLTAASKMIVENDMTVEFTEPQQFTSLKYGDAVAGGITQEDIIMQFIGSGAELQYYLIKVNDSNVIVMKTIFGSQCERSIQRVMDGQSDSMQYKGKVNILTESDSAQLNLDVLTQDVLYRHGLTRHLNDILIRQCIDITVYDDFADMKYIIVTIIGALLMIAATVWAFWKPFKKIGLSYGARMGKVDLDLTIKDDLPAEQGWFTEKDSQEQFTETQEAQPMKPIDLNPPPVDFYQSGINDEGNFYVQKSEEPETILENDINFQHKHKNY